MKSISHQCKHLTYAYPCYLGCTLTEIFFITLGCIAMTLLLATILYGIWGQALLNVMILLLFIYPEVRLIAGRIGKLKHSRPPNYVMLRSYQWWWRQTGMPSKFIERQGIWSTLRSQ